MIIPILNNTRVNCYHFYQWHYDIIIIIIVIDIITIFIILYNHCYNGSYNNLIVLFFITSIINILLLRLLLLSLSLPLLLLVIIIIKICSIVIINNIIVFVNLDLSCPLLSPVLFLPLKVVIKNIITRVDKTITLVSLSKARRRLYGQFLC